MITATRIHPAPATAPRTAPPPTPAAVPAEATARRLADAVAEFDAALDAGCPMPVLVKLDQEVDAAARCHRAVLAGLPNAS